MKVKIKKWDAVATWRWDLPEDDVCGICQAHFDGTCPTCKYPGDDCSLRKFAFVYWPSSACLFAFSMADFKSIPKCLGSAVTTFTWLVCCLATLEKRDMSLKLTARDKALYNGVD